MADEILENGQDELEAAQDVAQEAAEEASEPVVDAVDEVVTEVADEVAAEATEVVEEPAVPASELDEQVETAVRNVAEEAVEQEKAEAAEKKKRERRSKQARAAKQEHEAAFAAPVEEKKGLAALGVPAWLGISAACLAIGLCLGRFVLGGGGASSSSIGGVSKVAEGQLDDTYATYTYNGQTENLSIRQIMEEVGSVDSMKDEEGNYTLPTAEYAISVARNSILLKEAESRGITVSEKDISAYAETNLGTSDFDAIATNYGMDADSVKKIIQESCTLNALRDEVVGAELPAQPEAPTAPEEGKEEEVTKDYADYIIKVAGDEWDAEKGKWADKDGTFATALKDAEFTADGASYDAATTAYYVAYQLYSEQQNELTTKWTEFSNNLMSNASIQVNTLVQ